MRLGILTSRSRKPRHAVTAPVPLLPFQYLNRDGTYASAEEVTAQLLADNPHWQPGGDVELSPLPAGDWPYPERPADDEATAPRRRLGPVFRPAPASVTAPIPALAGQHARPVRRHAPETLELLQQVLDGLRNLPGDTPEPSAVLVSRPYTAEALRDQDAPPSKADRFAADMRHRGGLPVFRQTAREGGWRGIDDETPTGNWAAWPTRLRSRSDLAAVINMARAAEDSIDQAAGEIRQQWQQAWHAADMAVRLGYPGGAL